MTPEEIEELRALVGRLGSTGHDKNLAVVLGAALEHIHKQDVRIAELDEYAARMTKRANELETTIREKDDEIALLRNGYSTKVKQVATLQEIAVRERVKIAVMNFASGSHWSNPEKTEKTLAKVRSVARRQLAEEHPEAFG